VGSLENTENWKVVNHTSSTEQTHKLALLIVVFYFCIQQDRFMIKNTKQTGILMRPAKAFVGNTVIIGINILSEPRNKGAERNHSLHADL
jgi:hypothetical protein